MIFRLLLLILLSLCGLAQDRYQGQTIEAILAAGGIIHLPVGVHIIHSTVVLAPGTQLVCDPGAEITDDPTRHLAAMLVTHGVGIAATGCTLRSRGAVNILAPGSGTFQLVLNQITFQSENDAHGIWIDQPDVGEVSVMHSSFDRLTYAVGVNVHAGNLKGLRIEGNTFTNIHADGVEINNPVTNDCCGIRLLEGQTASAISIKNNIFSVVHHAKSNLSAGFCIGVAGAHDVTIEDNSCVAWNEGIHIEDRAFDIKVIHNRISTDYSAGHPYQAGIQAIDGHDIIIEKNELAKAEADGIFISYDPRHQVSNFTVSDNIISDCGDAGIFVAGGSLGPMNGVIANNEIYGCRRQIALSGTLTKLAIRNNRLGNGRGCPFSRNANVNLEMIQFSANVDRISGKLILPACAPIEEDSVGIRR